MEPVACKLTGGQMAGRQAELRAIFSGRVVESVRDGRSLRLELRDSPGLSDRLMRVVELERACCPFLDLDVARDGERVVLRIDGPPEAGAVIDGFERLTS